MAQVAKVPLDTMNKVLNVLGSMPYSQVVDLITEVRSTTTVEEVAEPEEKEKKETK